MIAAMRSEFGPLPDQSMHEKTAVPALIGEIYTFLRQADARELNKLFRALDKARKEGDKVEVKQLLAKIDNFETHIVPIIADIDAGFGNEEATYLLAKKMIEAGAACIQMENQVGFLATYQKQCIIVNRSGVRREAVRPPSGKSDRASRGLHCQDQRSEVIMFLSIKSSFK